MLRDTKLRFGRLSPIARWTMVGLVLCCGLLIAGLRGPSGSALAMAEEPGSQKESSEVAKEESKSDEGAVSSDVIDTSFFSENVSAIVVLRPAAAFGDDGAAMAVKLLTENRRVRLLPPGTLAADVRQVTIMAPTEPNDLAVPTIRQINVFQFARPIAEAFLKQQSTVMRMEEKELQGKKLYVNGSAMLLYDEYTVVYTASELLAKQYLESKRGVLPKWLPAQSWETLRGHQAVIVAESKSMRHDDATINCEGLSPVLMVLCDETDWMAVGADLNGKLAFHALLSVKHDDGISMATRKQRLVRSLKAFFKDVMAATLGVLAGKSHHDPLHSQSVDVANELIADLKLQLSPSDNNVVQWNGAVPLAWGEINGLLSTSPDTHQAGRVIDQGKVSDQPTSQLQPKSETKASLKSAGVDDLPKMMSANNLGAIQLAMGVFESATGRFPAAYRADKEGKPLLSWRVLILPFIDQMPLYQEFNLNEPWDSEHNKPLIAKMPKVFKRPNGKPGEGKTNYLTVRGENTAFPGGKGCMVGEIPDGRSNTIATVEVNDEMAVIWTKPDDFAYDEKDPMKGLVGLWPDGFFAGFLDGSVHFIPSTIDPTTLNHLFLRNDGFAIDPEALNSKPKSGTTTPPKSAGATPQGTPAATGNATEKKEKAAAAETAATKGDAAPAASKTDNIVLNPSAEEGEAWLQGAEIPGVTYTWDKKVAFEGKASLCIKKTVNRYFPIAEWGQTVKRTGNLPCLEMSAQVKAKRVTKAVLDVVFLDKDGKPIKHQWAAYIGAKEMGDKPVDHDWKQYSGKVAIPDGTAEISIVLQDYGPGTVWFDDIQARYVNGPADDPEKLLGKKPVASVKPATATRPAASDSTTTSSSSDVIQEGIGWKDIKVGMSKKELFKALGNPDPPPASNAEVGVFCWAEKHIDCVFLASDAGVTQIRFGEGFQDALANGLKPGSPSDGVVKLYGEPESTKDLNDGVREYEYSKKGILFWTYQGKIVQIVVVKPHHRDQPVDSPKTSTASDASETIQEGIGLKDIKVGMTKEEVIKVMGPTDDDSKPNWLKWRKKHIECTFYEGATGVSELRILPGFHGAFANGIQIGSPGDQVVKQYGEPTEMRQENGGKFYAYQNHGVFFWTRNGKVTSITVVKSQGNAQPSTANPSSPEKSSAAPAGSASDKNAASAEPSKEKPTSVTMNNKRYLVENRDSNAAAESPSTSSSTTTELKYDDGKSDGQHSYADAGEMIQYTLSAKKGRLQGIRIFGSRYGEVEPPDEDFTISILNEDGSKVLFTEAAPYRLFEREDPRWVDVDFKNARDVPETFWIALNFNALPTKGVYVHYDTSTGGKYSQIGLPGEECVDVDFGGDWMIRVKLADASANAQVIREKPAKIAAPKKESPESEKEAEAAHSADLEKTALVLKYDDGKSDGQRSLGGSGEAIEFTLPTEKGQIKGIRLFGSRYGLPQPPKEDVLVYLLNEDMSQVLYTETIPYKTFPRVKKPVWIDVNFKQARDVPKVFWVAIDFKAHETQGVYLHFDTSTEGKYSKIGLPGKGWKDVDFGGDWMIRAILEKTSEDKAKP